MGKAGYVPRSSCPVKTVRIFGAVYKDSLKSKEIVEKSYKYKTGGAAKLVYQDQMQGKSGGEKTGI